MFALSRKIGQIAKSETFVAAGILSVPLMPVPGIWIRNRRTLSGSKTFQWHRTCLPDRAELCPPTMPTSFREPLPSGIAAGATALACIGPFNLRDGTIAIFCQLKPRT